MSSLGHEPSPDRIAADIEAIASFSETDPAIGYSRPTFSAPWAAARGYVVREAEKVGAVSSIDPAGNVHIRRPEHADASSVWLSGSHVDSVPSGGRYDGVMGVVIPLEILRVYPELPLELVIFAEEEGTTFGLGMLGSRSWVGELRSADLAQVKNKGGLSYLEAGAPYGVDPAAIDRWRIDPSRYRGLVEVHAEQGRSLWDSGGRVAAVRLINGRRQYEVDVQGQENHAGSTAMPGRRDALAGAAEMVGAVESLAGELGGSTVLTVGSLHVEPNAVNVIPGRSKFTIDFRAPEAEILSRGDRLIGERIAAIAKRRSLTQTLRESERIEPMPLDDTIVEALRDAARSIDAPIEAVTSGALHDAAILAPLVPTAMLFVASRDGISHNPEEFSRTEDIALAARILACAIERDTETAR